MNIKYYCTHCGKEGIGSCELSPGTLCDWGSFKVVPDPYRQYQYFLCHECFSYYQKEFSLGTWEAVIASQDDETLLEDASYWLSKFNFKRFSSKPNHLQHFLKFEHTRYFDSCDKEIDVLELRRRK